MFNIEEQIAQPVDVAAYRSAFDQVLAQADQALKAIENQNTLNYQNTYAALETATEELEQRMTLIEHLESVVTTPEIRALHEELEQKFSSFAAGIPLRDGLWKALKRFGESPEASQLDATQKRFVSETVKNFKHAGADLPTDQKEAFRALSVELTSACTRFAQNTLEATNAFELLITDENELKGVPAHAIEMFKQSAKAAGKEGCRITLQAPSYMAILTYAEERSLREKLYRAFMTRATTGTHNNLELLPRILELRAKKATMLGYAHFADYVLSDRMAKNAATVLRFTKDLAEKAKPFYEKEHQSLEAFAREHDKNPNLTLAPWDIGYYAEKQRKALFDLDDEALRPYFSATRVVEGAFAIASKLFGIRFNEQKSQKGWHPDVRVYTIDDKSGTRLASFYVDLFPRPTKRDGAWMNALRTSPNAQHKDHMAVLCANLTPPSDTRPALLNLREVETIFHELGHVLHHCLSQVSVRSLAGTNVAWDFVELPSQIMENWVWEREALGLFAEHYQTHEEIPQALLDKLRRSRTYREAAAMMRQLSFGEVDLLLHSAYDPTRDGTIQPYAQSILQRYAAIKLPEDDAMIASFGHLFASPTGYAAGYYSYKWAELLEADAFGRFKREGVLSERTGAAYRSLILARGNSAPPEELFREFMGRDPDSSALLERAGLVS